MVVIQELYCPPVDLPEDSELPPVVFERTIDSVESWRIWKKFRDQCLENCQIEVNLPYQYVIKYALEMSLYCGKNVHPFTYTTLKWEDFENICNQVFPNCIILPCLKTGNREDYYAVREGVNEYLHSKFQPLDETLINDKDRVFVHAQEIVQDILKPITDQRFVGSCPTPGLIPISPEFYIVRENLGSGGTGTVFRAKHKLVPTHEDENEEFALKTRNRYLKQNL